MDRRAVYFYTLPGETTCAGLALDAHIHGETLRFSDTIRGREIPGKIKKETANSFVFTATGNDPGDWEFMLLTIEAFKHKYYKLVEGGQVMAAKLKTTDDLHQWYRREFKV
ncbi:MAG: hypothetical protein KBA08_06180 [Firmicutes bacterium]|nr:hypothetical protein [Bacillota bacterium]